MGRSVSGDGSSRVIAVKRPVTDQVVRDEAYATGLRVGLGKGTETVSDRDNGWAEVGNSSHYASRRLDRANSTPLSEYKTKGVVL